MSIVSDCNSISSTLTHNLDLALTGEQRACFSAAALEEIKKILPELDSLLVEKGDASLEYREARDAVLELVTFAAIPFVRSCTDYGRGIALLQDIADTTGQTGVKKRLVAYSNQLKKRWHEADPGGIRHNPRARQNSPVNSNTFTNIFIICVTLIGAAVFLAHMDLTSFVFPRWNQPGQGDSLPLQTLQDNREEMPLYSLEPQKEMAQPSQIDVYYSFSDEQGTVHMVNDLAKVPPQYRHKMKVVSAAMPRNKVTPVVIKGNQVLVPVTLSHRGRSVQAMLLLDTGATTISINERVASILGVQSSELRSVHTTVADGRTVESFSFVADSIAVGSNAIPHLNTTILAGGGGEGYDGLLGMNYLKNFRYHVDFDRSVMEWGG